MLLLTAMTLSGGTVVQAQEATTESTTAMRGSEIGELVVTARKRDETLIAVPVVLTAVSGAELQRRGISNLDGLARAVPMLTIGEGGGTVQGGTIALRGIAGPDTNPFGDQAVSFNIDSVQVAKASVRRLGDFDIQQVEVLKGPQALFFGKNSPGGVISMRTADPTDTFSAKLQGGYEFNAHEWRGEGHISGPLTDTLGARLAFYGSDMRGWVDNIVPEGHPLSPTRSHVPENTEWGVRGTLLFEPTDRFTARLKFTYGRMHGSGAAANFQYINCPYNAAGQFVGSGGVPQFVGVNDDCRADNKVSHADIGPTFEQYEPLLTSETYSRMNQQLGSLELNYQLDDNVTLTSVTGFYRVKYLNSENFTTGAATEQLPEIFPGFSLGTPMLPSTNNYYNREITQELRLQSDFSGPINFTIGGLYQDTRATTGSHTFAKPEDPIEFNEYYFVQEGKAWSFFGQLMWQVVPTFELSAGGRFSHEEKKLPLVVADITGNPAAPGVQLFPAVDEVKFDDFSPEVTATWRPNQDLTLFGSYKRGFLSGGFNSSSVDVTIPLDYGPQKVRGFEAGIKAALFDRTLRFNLSAYKYKVLGLQVTSYQDTVATIRNAGRVSIKGVEADFIYSPPVDGLTVRGGGAYNRGRYQEYFGPCYAGQTIAMGCDLVMNNSPVQDLAGTQLRNSPEWAGFFGVNYEMPIGSTLKIGLSGDMNYTSSELTDSKSNPRGRSPKRALVDAAIRLAQAEDRWELALIGRNLTNKHYWSSSQDVPLSGAPSGGGGVTGTLSDLFAVISRGREVMLRATYNFGQ